MYKWADTSTRRGQVEKLIEPIISGGATDKDIENVVSNLIKYIERAEA